MLAGLDAVASETGAGANDVSGSTVIGCANARGTTGLDGAARGSWANNGPSEVIRVSSTSMAIRRFSPFASGAKPKGIKTRDALDVAARYFVYKLHDATRRDRIRWVPLKGLDETQ